MHSVHRWASRQPLAQRRRDPAGAEVGPRFLGASCAPGTTRAAAPLALTSLLLVAALTGACSAEPAGTDQAAAASPADGAARTRSTEPPGTEPQAVEPYLSELLHEYDRLVHEFTLDPTVAADPSHPLAVELTELFTSDSDVPSLLLETWAEDYSRPPDDDDPTLISTLDGVETLSDDEVELRVCVRQRIYDYDSDAWIVRGIGYEHGVAEGTARRVDSRWLLENIAVAAPDEECHNEEAG